MQFLILPPSGNLDSLCLDFQLKRADSSHLLLRHWCRLPDHPLVHHTTETQHYTKLSKVQKLLTPHAPQLTASSYSFPYVPYSLCLPFTDERTGSSFLLSATYHQQLPSTLSHGLSLDLFFSISSDGSISRTGPNIIVGPFFVLPLR
jgi:hypothetical protein